MGIATSKFLALKMFLCNETEPSASSPVHSVLVQTRSIHEDCDSDINYNDRGNLFRKIKKLCLLLLHNCIIL